MEIENSDTLILTLNRDASPKFVRKADQESVGMNLAGNYIGRLEI